MGHSPVTTTEIYAKFNLRRLEMDFPSLVNSNNSSEKRERGHDLGAFLFLILSLITIDNQKGDTKTGDTLQILNPFTQRSLTQPTRNDRGWVRLIRGTHILGKFFETLRFI